MGKALEVVTGIVTFSNTVITAVTPAAGNTLTIRNAAPNSKIYLVNAWSDHQFAGILRIRSPQLHDAESGLRFDAVPSEVKPYLPRVAMQQLISQDQLTVELSAADAAADIESACMLLYYEDLLGIEGRFISADELKARLEHIYAVENTLATGVGGGYTGEEALNAEFDQFKANRDYALMGYLVDTECAAVRWRGADTGNLGVGGPGDELGRDYTRSWFVDLARETGIAMIPVFNAANKAGILLDAVQDENGADVTVTTILGLLKSGGGF